MNKINQKVATFVRNLRVVSGKKYQCCYLQRDEFIKSDGKGVVNYNLRAQLADNVAFSFPKCELCYGYSIIVHTDGGQVIKKIENDDAPDIIM